MTTQHQREDFFNEEGYYGSETEIETWLEGKTASSSLEKSARKQAGLYEETPYIPTTSGKTTTIPEELYQRLDYLGLIPSDIRNYNVGESNYSSKIIQPWSIWLDYELNSWDADIVKRVLRTKESDSRELDYEKIIHICQERLRQLSHTKETNVN